MLRDSSLKKEHSVRLHSAATSVILVLFKFYNCFHSYFKMAFILIFSGFILICYIFSNFVVCFRNFFHIYV